MRSGGLIAVIELIVFVDSIHRRVLGPSRVSKEQIRRGNFDECREVETSFVEELSATSESSATIVLSIVQADQVLEVTSCIQRVHIEHRELHKCQ